MKETPLSELQFATFAKQQNSTFQVASDCAGPVLLELVAVELHQSTARAESFSLLFAGPKDLLLGQATYFMEHAVLGHFPMFIVPVRRDERCVYYEAIFNRQAS